MEQSAQTSALPPKKSQNLFPLVIFIAIILVILVGAGLFYFQNSSQQKQAASPTPTPENPFSEAENPFSENGAYENPFRTEESGEEYQNPFENLR